MCFSACVGSVCFLSGVLLCNCVHGARLRNSACVGSVCFLSGVLLCNCVHGARLRNSACVGSVCFLSGVLLCNCVHGARLRTKESPNDPKSIKNAHKNRHKSAQGAFSSVSGRRLCKSRSQGVKRRSGYRTKVDPLGE